MRALLAIASFALSYGIVLAQQSASPPAGNPRAPRRLALLLANGAYRHLPQSQAPMKGVQALAEPLKAAGFELRIHSDVSLAGMLKEVESEFLGAINRGDVCFIFYSGYAVQSGDDNYILPVEFDPAAKGPLDQRARSVIGLQQALDSKHAGLKMVVIDALRQDPRLLALSTGAGLTIPDVIDVQEIIYAFSASPNVLAPEYKAQGPDPFAAALAGAIAKPGLSAVDVFSSVQAEVGRASSQQQTPFFLPKTTQSFLFRKAEPVATVAAKVGQSKDQIRPNRVDRQEYVYIPAGTFKQGCVPKDTRCSPPEKPQHSVKISSGFWMGRTEVEISAYQRYVDADKKAREMPSAPMWDRKWRVTNHPVTGLDWEEAGAYCAWAGGRLPTEAEWEYAARAGAADQVYPLDDENSRDKANFTGKKGNDRYETTAPVRSFDQNAFGLFDMAGNVWEWVSDWYAEDYYAHAEPADPKGPLGGKSHVVRGGSWDSDPREHLRISYRLTYPKGGNKVGFRCVLPDTPKVREQLF